MWEPIESITPAGTETVWDICVPETGCFIANGIVSKNSGRHEEVSDVIFGLYRESYYDPNCDNPNLLEVMVLKNRQGPAGGTVNIWYEPEYHRFSDVEVTRTKIVEEVML